MKRQQILVIACVASLALFFACQKHIDTQNPHKTPACRLAMAQFFNWLRVMLPHSLIS